MLESRFSGNDATRYGKSCEGQAFQEYTRLTNNTVTKLGLVVNPLVPWLGYSPIASCSEMTSPTFSKKHEKLSNLLKEY